MHTAAMTSCFITGCSSKAKFADSEILVSHGGLFQQFFASHLAQAVYSRKAFLKLTNALIYFAERAHTGRDADALEEVSRILMNLPIDSARQIGVYYNALAINRKGRREEAEALLETVADNAPITYRARAIQTLGANHHDKGLLDEALRFQFEALRAASDKNARGLLTTMMAHLEISHFKSDVGDHKGALAILENVSPLVRIVAKQTPLYFYLYHNELAIELSELGRLAEAKAASEVAIASPYAPVYPNWAETREELEAKRTSATPSVVAINRTSEVIPPPQMELQPCLVRSQLSQIRKRVFAFCWLSSRGTFHKALVPIAEFSAIANCQTNRITLDQLGRCIRSRAPPASA